MWPFNTRRCRCGHKRRQHEPAWGWTTCGACRCIQFRWVRVAWYWDRKYRQEQRRG